MSASLQPAYRPSVYKPSERYPYHPRAVSRPIATPPRRRVVKVKKQVVYQTVKDKSIRINLAFYIYAVVVFAGVMSLLLVNAATVNKRNDVETLRRQVKTQSEANQSAQMSLLSSYDENVVLERAALLGMAKPKPYQIIYINVPKESYARGGYVTENEAAESSAKSLVRGLFEFLSGN